MVRRHPGRNLGLNAVAGKPPEFYNIDASRYDEMRPGCYDVDERVRDMNAGGQLAGLNFPNWTGFSGQVLEPGPRPRHQRGHDQGLQRLARRRVVRRLPRPLHPLRHPPAVRRRGGGQGGPPPRREGLPRRHLLGEPRGARTCRRSTPASGTRSSPPAATTGTVLCCHLGSSSQSADDLGRRARRRDHDALVGRHRSTRWSTWCGPRSGSASPTLKFSLTEGDIGWIPYFLWRAEHVNDRHRGWMQPRLLEDRRARRRSSTTTSWCASSRRRSARS